MGQNYRAITALAVAALHRAAANNELAIEEQAAAQRPLNFTVEDLLTELRAKLTCPVTIIHDGRFGNFSSFVTVRLGTHEGSPELLVQTLPRVEWTGPVEVEACPMPVHVIWSMTLDQSDVWRVEGRLSVEEAARRVSDVLYARRHYGNYPHPSQTVERMEPQPPQPPQPPPVVRLEVRCVEPAAPHKRRRSRRGGRREQLRRLRRAAQG